MIKVENLSETLVRHYSDCGMKLLQVETGIVYDEAIDIVPCQYTYEETDQRVDAEEE